MVLTELATFRDCRFCFQTATFEVASDFKSITNLASGRAVGISSTFGVSIT